MEIKISNLTKSLCVSMFCLAFSSEIRAAQEAVVAVDGSMVYKSADFDSAVIGYLPRGKKVKISSKPFGAFHRVGLKQGMMGYISDADLLDTEGRPMSEVNTVKEIQKNTKGSKSARTKKDKEISSSSRKRPVHVATAIGATVASISYRELINRRDYSDQITFFGLKFTTRAGFIDGSFGMELDALYYSGAPGYYSTVSSTAPSGYIAIFDLVLTYAIFDFSKHAGAITVGAGPMLSLSETRTELAGQKFQQSRTELGAVLNATVSYRIQPVILKIEPRYYIERSSYIGYHVSLLYAFN